MTHARTHSRTHTHGANYNLLPASRAGDNKLDWANSAPTYPQTGHHSRHMV